MKKISLLIVTIVLLVAAPPEAKAFNLTRLVDCSAGQKVADALKFALPGETILLNGTCNENLFISSPFHQFDGITLDGQGVATLNGPDATLNTIELVGVQGFTVKRLTVTGGFDGISINTSPGTAIDTVVVQNVGRIGVHFQRASTMGFVVNSTIQNNPSNGLVINENSYVRVGFSADVGASQGATGPNVISNNGGFGIRVQRSAVARIYLNTIDSNANDGIHVESDSYAEVASNEIGGNAKNGVFVSENSVLHLGNATGTKNEDNPNTSTAPNGAFGLAASWGAYVQGRQGTLTGTSGAASFAHGSNNNLTP